MTGTICPSSPTSTTKTGSSSPRRRPAVGSPRSGTSRQREYDPFGDPRRAVKEEFGDLLAEGLYARLDAHWDISGVDIAYWADFIESRAGFLSEVAESLTRHPDRSLDNEEGRKVRAARVLDPRGPRSAGANQPGTLPEVHRPLAG